MDYKDLTDMQKSALLEVGNIGAGNAATSLSKIVKRSIQLEVPQVQFLEFNNVSKVLGGPDMLVCGVYLEMVGDAEAHILLLFSAESVVSLLKVLLPGYDICEDITALGELEASAMQEVGNILASAYICALADFSGLSLQPSVPALAVDMAGSILDVFMIEYSMISDKVLLIETQMEHDAAKLDGYFFLIPRKGALKTILNALGVI